MFTKSIRTYDIDLTLPEERRWREVIAREKSVARGLAKQALADLDDSWVARTVLGLGGGAAFRGLYKLSGGRYMGEMQAWATALRTSPERMVLANCSYELAQTAEYVGGVLSNFGCTAGVRHVRGLGMVHVRNLDWPLDGFGKATRLFRFHNGKRKFTTVGLCGFVGALSGMVPGGYSVTINYAPAADLPLFRFGPAFLLREVFEECDTYAEAVRMLRDTPLAAPVFFTVCGTRQGEGCVIERTPTESAVRSLKSGVLVQANHHVARKFVHRNAAWKVLGADGEITPYDWSTERADELEAALTACSTAKTLEEVAGCLDGDSVCNALTGQKMVFQPATGEMRVWRG